MSESSFPNRNCGQSLGGLGLADTRWAQEDERTGGTLGILEAGPGPADRLRHGDDGVVLSDDAEMKLGLHLDETGSLLFGEAMDGDSGPLRQDLGDFLFVDDPAGFGTGFAEILLALDPIGQQRALLVAQLGGPLVLLRVDGFALLAANIGHLLVDLGEIGVARGPVDPHAAPGFVDQVDGLVGKIAIGDVAVGEVGGRDDGVVGEAHRVMRLVAILRDPSGSGWCRRPMARPPGPVGTAAPGRSPSRGTCGTPRGWWLRWSAVRRGPASA